MTNREGKKMNKKLYRVTCQGMNYGLSGKFAHGVAYVVAFDPEDAYLMLRESLDNRDLGFSSERELKMVELIAEVGDYPACGAALYI